MPFYTIQAGEASFSAQLEDQLTDLICTIESLHFSVEEGLDAEVDDSARREALLNAIYVIGRSLELQIAHLEALITSKAASE